MIVIAKALGVVLFVFLCGIVGVLYDFVLTWKRIGREHENKRKCE